MSNEELFDVVIYEINTSTVEEIAIEKVHKDTGFYNAEKMADSVASRLNYDFSTAIIPTGTLSIGDIIDWGSI